MPWTEIEKKFTRSELVIVGWRSQEISAELDRKFKKVDRPSSGIRQLDRDELRQPGDGREGMTESEALEYFAGRGIVFPTIR